MFLLCFLTLKEYVFGHKINRDFFLLFPALLIKEKKLHVSCRAPGPVFTKPSV